MSSPLAIVYDLQSGHPPHTTIAHAHRALGLSYPDFGETEVPAPNSTLLHPDSSALAILFDAFQSGGWPAEQAIVHAATAMGLDPAELTCNAYPVTIVYCDTSHEQTISGWLNVHCCEDPDGDPFTADGLDICDVASCQPPSPYRWMSLTVSTSCGNLPSSGTGIQMRIKGAKVPISCTKVMYECDCFNETDNGVNCSSIETCCCSSATSGCTGCPTCSGGCPSP
jgi:hypothetical protein